MMNRQFSLLLLFLCLSTTLFQPSAWAWGVGHAVITKAAVNALPESLLQLWSTPYKSPFSKVEQPISKCLCETFCYHPDTVDGPSAKGDDIPERRRATRFLYAEKDGIPAPPVAYADPDRDPKARRPWTYHYFIRTPEQNRAFIEAGARWYFTKIAGAFRSGNHADAAEYSGAFIHAIEDRVSPYHVWDGYNEEREALEDSLASEGLQSPEGSRGGHPKNTSHFWGVDGPRMNPDLSSHKPVALGETIEQATPVFVKRLYESREFARAIYSDRNGFIAAHLADDWRNQECGEQTNSYLTKIATENAKLVADVIYTAWVLAGKPAK